MALHNMMFNGISGLNSMSSNMAVLGQNIANVNTTSFKTVQTTFQNVLTSSQGRLGEAGNGSQVAATNKNFRPGQLEATSSSTDMALTGQGFFMLRDNVEGELFYGRDGQFRLDHLVDGSDDTFHLVTPAGWHVQGVNTGSSPAPDGTIENIVVRRESFPQATENIRLALNLEYRSPEQEIAGHPPLYATWDGGQASPMGEAYDYRAIIEAYGGQGESFPLTVYFNQTEDRNEWEFMVTHAPELDRRVKEDGSRYNDGESPEKGAGALLYGKLTFNTVGELENIRAWELPAEGDFEPGPDNMLPFGPDNGLYSFAYNLGSEANLNATIDFGATFGDGLQGAELGPIRTTNYAANSSVIFQSQDGFAVGRLQGVTVKPDGVIVGHYSNGQSIEQAQVMLADFTNYRGLVPAYGNTYTANKEAGELIVGIAGRGTFGEVAGNSLEVSNVDLGRQFVDLMMTQRIFQANSKSITTADEIFNTLIRLK